MTTEQMFDTATSLVEAAGFGTAIESMDIIGDRLVSVEFDAMFSDSPEVVVVNVETHKVDVPA